jgi:hypothetical protein
MITVYLRHYAIDYANITPLISPLRLSLIRHAIIFAAR